MNLSLNKVEEPSMQKMHDEEVELFNSLFSLLENDAQNIDAINSALTSLQEHTTVHFSHEEDLMQAVNFPPYPAHAAEHKSALEKMTAMITQWQQDHNSAELKHQLEQDYLAWLKRHVSTMDDLTAQFYQRTQG